MLQMMLLTSRGREFIAEVEMLNRLHHRNLVKLIGIYTGNPMFDLRARHEWQRRLTPESSTQGDYLQAPFSCGFGMRWTTYRIDSLESISVFCIQS